MEINPTQHPAVAATSPARRAVPRLLLATLVALPLTLAACTPQSEPPPAPLPMPSVNTTSSSAVASESQAEASPAPTTPQAQEIEPPVPSDVAQENSFDGAEAYAYFLFQAWWYLINTHDIDWWDANIPDCDWKTQKRDEAADALQADVIDHLPPLLPETTERAVNELNASEYQIRMRSPFGPLERTLPDGELEVLEDKGTLELTAHLLYDSKSWRLVRASIVRVGER